MRKTILIISIIGAIILGGFYYAGQTHKDNMTKKDLKSIETKEDEEEMKTNEELKEKEDENVKKDDEANVKEPDKEDYEEGFIEEYPKEEELYFVGFHTASNPIEREDVYGFSNGSFRFANKSTALKLEKEGFVEDHLDRLIGENIICLDILTWRDKFEKGKYYTSEDIKELGGNPKEIEYTTKGNVEFSDGRCSGHSGTYKGDFILESCPTGSYLIFEDGVYKGKESKITEECKNIKLSGFKNNREEIESFGKKIANLLEIN